MKVVQLKLGKFAHVSDVRLPVIANYKVCPGIELRVFLWDASPDEELNVGPLRLVQKSAALYNPDGHHVYFVVDCFAGRISLVNQEQRKLLEGVIERGQGLSVEWDGIALN